MAQARETVGEEEEVKVDSRPRIRHQINVSKSSLLEKQVR